MSVFRSFRVRIVVSWVVFIVGAISLYAGEPILWFLSLIAAHGIRYSMRPPIPRPPSSQRGQIFVLIGVLLLGALIYLVLHPRVSHPIVPMILYAAIAVMILCATRSVLRAIRSDYRLFISSRARDSSPSEGAASSEHDQHGS